MAAKEATSLKLTGFEIEVDDELVVLLMQTDKGPFSVEIPQAQLSKLIYALRFVQYAGEPLRERRARTQASAQPLRASMQKPAKKPKGK